MAYTTQTLDQPRGGFNVVRFIAGLVVVTLVVVVAGAAVMLSPLANSARALTFHSSIVDRAAPLTLAPGTTASVTLRFRNAGLTAWERGGTGTQVDLGVKNDSLEFARAGMAVGWLTDSRIATTMESVVPPGAVGTFTFTVRAPTTVGLYPIPVRPVNDGVTWLDDQDVFVVVASDFGFHSELIDQSRHPTLRVGETSAPITVRLRNTGSRAWVRGTAAEQVNLGIAGDARPFGPLALAWPSPDRVAIQSEPRVQPGESASFVFRVRAPTTAGTYALRLQPVVDGVTWLEDAGVMTLITVTTASGQPQAQAAQAATTLFTTSASVTPASVPVGDAASIKATFTSNTAATALVGVEVYTPDGASLAFQKWFEGQSFTPGEPRSFPVLWQVPMTAAAGNYSVSLRVFAPGWKTQLSAADGAATFSVAEPVALAPAATSPSGGTSTAAPALAGGSDAYLTTERAAADAAARNNGRKPTPTPTVAPTATVAPTPIPVPSFTTIATVTPVTIAPTGSVSITASFTSASAATVNLIVSIYAPGASLAAYQQSFVGQSFGAGQQRTYPVAWLVPSDATSGTYRVGLGAYSSDWVTEYNWTESAATFAVAAPAPSPTPASTVTPVPTATPVPSFTLSANVSPSSVIAGGGVTISATATSATAVSGAIVDIYVYAPDGATLLGELAFRDQTFTAGQQRSYSMSWTTALGASPGTYIVKVGVAAADWTQTYSWNGQAATFAVTAAPATPTPTTAPTATPAPGSLVPIAYRAGSSNSAASGLSLTLSVPAGVQNGDLLVATLADWPGVLTGPTGWTRALLASPNQGLWYRVAANEPASYTWSGSLNSSWAGIIDAFSGVSVATPLDVTPLVNSGSVASVTWPTMASLTDGAWHLVISSENNNTDTIAVPAGYTARSARGGSSLLRSSTRVISPAGIMAPTSTETSGAPSWHAYSVILRPAVASAVPAPTATATPTSTPTPSPTAVPTPAPTQTPTPTAPPSSAVSALRVEGNRIMNAAGQQVVLRGVNRSGTEYACVQGWGISEGAMDQASVNGIKSWHANVVRMPLNEQCWLGINGISSAYSGANYRTAITNYVNLLNQNGLYVLLDLHWSAPGTTLATRQVPMADLDHSPAFWSSVASTFKGNNAVIFELFNEPWPDNQQDSVAAWTCWRDGGTCPGVSFQVAGMQTMLNAVRATGATNIVALGGVGYSNYLSRWLQYKPSDPLNNLIAAWHAYNFNACSSVTCWNGAPASVIAQVPVSVTETGANTCDATWWNTLLDWLDAHQTGYQAWAWNTWGGADCTYSTGYVSLGALITNYAGTATPYGQIYKNHITRF